MAKTFFVYRYLITLFFFVPLSICFAMEDDAIIIEDDDRLRSRHPSGGPTSQSIIVSIADEREGEEERLLLHASSPPQVNLADKTIRGVKSLIRPFGETKHSAVLKYKLKTHNRDSQHYDSFNDFAQAMDVAFFRSSSVKVKSFRWAGSLFGIGVPVATSGLILGEIGQITSSITPILNPLIEAFVITTTFPVAAHVGYQRAGEIATTTFGERKFTAAGDEEAMDSKPHVPFKKSMHKVAIVLCGTAASLNALIPTVLMFYQEMPYFKGFAWASAPFIWGFYADTYYTLGRRYIGDFFNQYFYYTQSRIVKQQALLQGVKGFLSLVNDSDKVKSNKFVDGIYDTFINVLDRQAKRRTIFLPEDRQDLPQVQEKSKQNAGILPEATEVELTDEEIMLFSLLMLKDPMRESSMSQSHSAQFSNPQPEVPADAQDEEEQSENDTELGSLETDSSPTLRQRLMKAEGITKTLQNKIKGLEEENEELVKASLGGAFFRKDVDSITSSWKQAMMETVSEAFVGAAFYGRIEILRTTLQQVFEAVGIDPLTAQYMGYGIATPEVIFRTLVETNIHKKQFAEWLNFFSFDRVTNLRFLRKTVDLSAAINGVLFSLPSLFVGLEAFEDYSLLTKIALLTPCCLLDFNIFFKLFSMHNNAIITGAATLGSGKNQCTFGKRAHLNRWAEEAIRTIPKLHPETIELLYTGIMKGS